MRCLGLLLSMAVLLAGCGEPLPPPDRAVSMTGAEIDYEAFESYLTRALGEPDAALASDVLSGLFDQFLDELLLRRWVEEEMSLGTGKGEDGLLVLLERLPSSAPTEADVRRYYEEHRADFQLPERVRLRQILLDEIDTARGAQAELLSGVEFTEVADRYARHPYTPAGGDQGVLARDDLPPAFEEIVFALQAGEFSQVVAADYGFHIFQVVERLAARSVPLAEARPEIERRLRRRLADAELAELVASARNRYNVRVHRRNLPFNYAGHYLDTHSTPESSDNADD